MMLLEVLVAIVAGIIVHIVCKWLDGGGHGN